MIPAAFVDSTIASLRPHLAAGDSIIDGGNSFFEHDIRRARDLAADGISLYRRRHQWRGPWPPTRILLDDRWGASTGFELGARLANPRARDRGRPQNPRSRGPAQPGEEGYLHCGPAGAGHFVKMIHNGIEYGLMAAYAEGLAVLERANLGNSLVRPVAATAPKPPPCGTRTAIGSILTWPRWPSCGGGGVSSHHGSWTSQPRPPLRPGTDQLRRPCLRLRGGTMDRTECGRSGGAGPGDCVGALAAVFLP